MRMAKMLFAGCAIFVVLLLTVGLINRLWSSPESTRSVELRPSSSNGLTAAQKLVALDSGRTPQEDDIEVRRNEYLLNSLSKATGLSSEAIADAARDSSDLLRDRYGRKATAQHMLEAANANADVRSGKTSIHAYLAAHVYVIGQ